MLWGRVVGKADLALLLAQPLCPLVLLRAEVAPADPPTAQCETACGNAMWERTMGTRHTRTPSGSDGLWEHPVAQTACGNTLWVRLTSGGWRESLRSRR